VPREGEKVKKVMPKESKKPKGARGTREREKEGGKGNSSHTAPEKFLTWEKKETREKFPMFIPEIPRKTSSLSRRRKKKLR